MRSAKVSGLAVAIARYFPAARSARKSGAMPGYTAFSRQPTLSNRSRKTRVASSAAGSSMPHISMNDVSSGGPTNRSSSACESGANPRRSMAYAALFVMPSPERVSVPSRSNST